MATGRTDNSVCPFQASASTFSNPLFTTAAPAQGRELYIHSAGLATRPGQAPSITCHGSRGPREQPCTTHSRAVPLLHREYDRSIYRALRGHGSLLGCCDTCQKRGWAVPGREGPGSHHDRGQQGPRPDGVNAAALLSGQEQQRTEHKVCVVSWRCCVRRSVLG